MPEKRPFLVTSEENQKLPILIVDKKGTIGAALAEKLKEQFLIVFVSGRELGIHQNIIHIPYRRRIPSIPDNAYSHIFLFYNGEGEMLDMLSTFMKKVNQTNSKLYFLLPLTHSSEQLFRRLSHHMYHSMQIIVCGEIFDQYITEANMLNFFIHQARIYHRIEAPKGGLGKLFPIWLEDLLQAIISIGFSLERQRRIHLIFPKHSYSEISVVRILQKKDPLLKIDFRKHGPKTEEYYIPPDGEYFFANYDLEEKLRHIDLTEKKIEAPPLQQKIKLVLPKRKKTYTLYFFSILILFLVFILPLLVTFLLAVGGAVTLQSSLKRMENGQFASAQQYAGFAKTSFATADSISGSLDPLDLIVKSQKEKFVENIQLGKQVSTTELDTLTAIAMLKKIASGTSVDPKGDFLHALATIKNSLLTLQKMQAEKHLPQGVTAKINDVSNAMTLFTNTIDGLPYLLGFEGERKYLVLFQNNMELRPGGGFIGSYGLLQIENGKMQKFQVYDVYTADGKLTTHVEPPYGLRRYLGASHWFLRDSNFDSDFTRDGASAAQFLQRETGEHVDGVIGIDTDFLKNILSSLGSVYVTDYKEQVTADNFYLLTQTHAEKNFFPGSTQKKDFLDALTSTMLTDLVQRKNISYISFIKKIGESIKTKHLLFAFSNDAVQKLFTVNDLSSSLWDGREKSPNSFQDYFGVVDANVGANKVNYYLKRSVEQNISISDSGSEKATATITYENTSDKTSPFGGDYRNYVRFVLPQNATLDSVAVDNKIISTTPAVTDPAIYTEKSFRPSTGLEVEKTDEENKTLFGFFVLVPMGTSKVVSVTYAIPDAISTQNPAFSYDLRVFKQPGTGEDPYSLFFSYPNSFKLVRVGDGMTDVGGKLTYSTKLATNTDIQADFSKK